MYNINRKATFQKAIDRIKESVTKERWRAIMKILDVSSIQDIPGYVEILKFVLKSQIQNLVEQLQDHAGEETLVLSANLTAGTLSHLESDRGQGFLDMREDIKSQFLTHCLQGKQKYHTAELTGHIVTGHRAAGPPQPATAEPQGQRAPGIMPAELQGNKFPQLLPAEPQVHNTPGPLSTEPQVQRATGPLHHNTAETQGHRAIEPLPADTQHHKDAGPVQPSHNRSIKLSSTGLPHTGTNRVYQSESIGLANTSTNKLTEISNAGLSHTSRNMSTQPNSLGLFETGTNKLIEQKCTALSQTVATTLTQSGSAGCQLFNKRICQDDDVSLSPPDINRLSLPVSQQTLTKTFPIQPQGKLKDTHLAINTQQNDKGDSAANQNSSKASRVSAFLSGPLTNVPTINQSMSGHLKSLPTINQSMSGHLTSLSTINQSMSGHLTSLPTINQSMSGYLTSLPTINQSMSGHLTSLSTINQSMSGNLTSLPTINQSVSGHLTSLPTINQSVVKDLMSFSYNAHVLPQFMQPFQSDTTTVKLIDDNQSSVSTLKSSQVSSLIYPETLSNLLGNQKSSPSKTTSVTNIPNHENMEGCKPNASISLCQENIHATSSCSQDICFKQDIKTPAKEQINKTAKRKQKRSSGSKLLSKNVAVQDSAIKKPRIFDPGFSQSHTITTDVLNTMTPSVHSKDVTNVHSVTPVLTNLSAPNVPNTAGFSLLKMQPVVLINDPNQGERKIFIESGSVNPQLSCCKTSEKPLLVEPNGHLANVASSTYKQAHAVDVKEKDKTKKTLSSKIDEITQRITKDDAIKQHTVQTSDCDQGGDIACSVTSRMTSAGNNGNMDSMNTEAGSHDVSTPPSTEHLNDGDPSKLKDGSRASHRKPKLPRFNIGVASDDEDNAEGAESSGLVSPETSSHPTANMSSFGIPPSTVNISHDDAQDIINIQVSGEDSETSFPHINLEELADGLLLTDIPIVSYYNSVEDSSKSLIESVFNLKPGRDPNTKKPLNSQSVIVSGSKLEKDWVKCPLCPDKFLTVEALQYHIKNENVNHVVKKYECDLCKRKFTQLRDMERHRRIHTGERPFTCDVCNKSFSRKDNLKSHARKHSVK